jgi:hypothetical protein
MYWLTSPGLSWWVVLVVIHVIAMMAVAMIIRSRAAFRMRGLFWVSLSFNIISIVAKSSLNVFLRGFAGIVVVFLGGKVW